MPRRGRTWIALSSTLLAACFLDSGGGPNDDATGPAASASTGSSPECTPAATENCYSGPSDTAGRGACRAGTRTCSAAGTWGECADEVLPAREDCSKPGDEDCNGHAPQCLAWARAFSDPGHGAARSVALGADGGVVVTGSTEGGVDFGGGAQPSESIDLFVLQLEPKGDHVADAVLGDTSAQMGLSVGVRADGTHVVAGRYRGGIFGGTNHLASPVDDDLFVAAFGLDGIVSWARGIGSVGDEDAAHLAVDSAGGVGVAGTVAAEAIIGATNLPYGGGTDAIVARFASDGQLAWARGLGDVADQHAWSIAADAAGDFVVTGSFGGVIDFGEGNVVTSLGGNDIFVVKLRGADGGTMWSHAFGDIEDQHAYAVAVADDGTLCLAGTFLWAIDLGGASLPAVGGTDAFVARLDADGTVFWARRIGGSGEDGAYAVAADDQGGCLATGAFSGTASFHGLEVESAGGTDAFVVKFDGAGQPTFVERFGDAAADQVGLALTLDADGGIVVAGAFAGKMDFGLGGTPSTSGGETDAFVARFDPP